MTMGEFNVNGRSELLSAIGAGTVQDRRRHMVHLARNDLHERATNILAACYVYSLNIKERPQNKISSATMDLATKLLGHVLAELLCLHDINIRMSELVERVAKASQTSSYSEKRIKIYINSALRLLAVFEILKPYERGRGRLQYQRGDLTKILYVYDVDLDNWQCAPFSMGAEEISINVIEPTLKGLTPDELAIVTNRKVKMSTIPPPPPAPTPKPPQELQHSIVNLAGQVIKMKVKVDKLQSAHDQLRREHDLLINLVNSICERLPRGGQ